MIYLNAKLSQVIPETLHDRLEKLKEEIGMSKNSIINAAIEEYIRTRNQANLEDRIAKLEKEFAEFREKAK